MNVTFLNGQKLENRNIISVFNPSFLYGINCFEGIRGYYSSKKDEIMIFDLEEHIDRLYESAARLEFNIPVEKKRLLDEIKDIIKTTIFKVDIYIRVTFFLSGESSWSEKEDISYLINMRPMPSQLFNETHISLTYSNFRRISSKIIPPDVKAGANYLNSRYALLDAQKKGFQGALFLSIENMISESTGSCIFFFKDDKFYTPSTDSDILIGITRNRIIKIIIALGYECIQKKIAKNEVQNFDAAFLVGTMIEIKKISIIEKQVFDINNPVINKVIDKFKSYVYGLDI